MEKLNPKIAKRKAVKGSDFYYNPSTNEMELQSDPSPLHVSNSEAEPKLHRPPLFFIVENILNVILQDTSSGMTESTN